MWRYSVWYMTKEENFFSKSQYIKDDLKVLIALWEKTAFSFLLKIQNFLNVLIYQYDKRVLAGWSSSLLRRVCQRCRWFNISFFTLLCFYPFSFIGFSVIHMLVNAEFVLGSFSLLSIFLIFDFFYSKE